MKTSLIVFALFFSFSAFAQPTVSGRTAPATDTVIFTPTSSITLTGTAIRANPGHPILDTTWTKTSGPAATITNPSNSMTTTVTGLVVGCRDGIHFNDLAIIPSQAKNGNSHVPLTYSYQISTGSSQAEMEGIFLVMTLLALFTLMNKLSRVHKCVVVGLTCTFLFSCSKSATLPDNKSSSTKTAYRLKQVDLDNHVFYSEIKILQ